MKYEIDIINYGKLYPHESTLSTLTGLPFEEVNDIVKSVGRKAWTGQMYIKVFQSIGFNTNPRFVKFDPDNRYPCIIRCSGKSKGYWYLFYYNDGVLYDGYGNSFTLDDRSQVMKLNKSFFLKRYDMKITSMLQVWI